MVSEQVVKLTSWVGMAPKKNRKQPQDSVLEEPVDDQVAPLKSIGEEEPMPREDRDEPESECFLFLPIFHFWCLLTSDKKI